MKKSCSFTTQIGTISLTELDGYIVELDFSSIEQDNNPPTTLLEQAKEELLEFFDGSRMNFSFPIKFDQGTSFQQKVWFALLAIPYGETWSYKRVAEHIGMPKAARAVGMANNKNPIPIIIPCHRVIGSNGKMVGYGGGLDKKVFLLELENKFHSG